MDNCTNITPDGKRESLAEVRASLLKQIESQKKAIQALEKAYNITYKKERCTLVNTDFKFFLS